MNIPNVLTMSRCVFAVIIGWLLSLNFFYGHVLSALLFFGASLTDYYDGYLAKKHQLTTNFGKIMDPITDKILILTVMFVFAHLGVVHTWMVAVIAVREVLVTASRLNAMSRGQVIAAEQAGKIKTVGQIITVSVILLFLICEQGPFASSWFYQVENAWKAGIHVLMTVSMLLTITSGVSYFQEKWKSQTPA